MSFLHLYKHIEEQALKAEPDRCPVDVGMVRDWILESGHATEIKVHAVKLDKDLSPGHVIIRDFREERWEAESDCLASQQAAPVSNTTGRDEAAEQRSAPNPPIPTEGGEQSSGNTGELNTERKTNDRP